MKKGIKLGSLLIIIALTIAPASSEAFNPLAHIFIAENACPSCSPKTDFYYGSIAPDIALYVANLADWPFAFDDTHEDYIDLRGIAWGSTQMAFARGWLTHGQNSLVRGADYFAHIDPFPLTGYVDEKAKDLLTAHPEILDLDFAHYIIEATIDLLLKYYDDPTLPGKLLFANLFRSWQDRNLLMRVFVWNWRDRRTDWLTLATAELTFRQLVNRYSLALMLPYPNDQEALAQLGAELAEEMFGLVGITSDMLLNILPDAITFCSDYQIPIQDAILSISPYLP